MSNYLSSNTTSKLLPTQLFCFPFSPHQAHLHKQPGCKTKCWYMLLSSYSHVKKLTARPAYPSGHKLQESSVAVWEPSWLTVYICSTIHSSMAASTCSNTHGHLTFPACQTKPNRPQTQLHINAKKIHEWMDGCTCTWSKRQEGGGDLYCGEGTLAAAVAEDAVEIERVQVAAHRAACRPSLPSSSPLHGQIGMGFWFFLGWWGLDLFGGLD